VENECVTCGVNPGEACRACLREAERRGAERMRARAAAEARREGCGSPDCRCADRHHIAAAIEALTLEDDR
jgi:hypothetical protein